MMMHVSAALLASVLVAYGLLATSSTLAQILAIPAGGLTFAAVVWFLISGNYI